MADAPSHDAPPAVGAEEPANSLLEASEINLHHPSSISVEETTPDGRSESRNSSKVHTEPQDSTSPPHAEQHIEQHNESSANLDASDRIVSENDAIPINHQLVEPNPKFPQDVHTTSAAAHHQRTASDGTISAHNIHNNHTLWTRPTSGQSPKYPFASDHLPVPEGSVLHSASTTHHSWSPAIGPSRLMALPELDAEQWETPLTTRSETPRRFIDETRTRDSDAVSTASDSAAFTPKTSPLRLHFPSGDNSDLNSSPDISVAHRPAPKETHLAEVEFDPVSGRKIINEYEVLSELGRGQHGKVKLCRSLQTSQLVAIKIIERVSKKRRLGRSSNQETKIKREIAILKKARHANIVSLLEIIDDPTLKKVYIVLECVENGEIKWRIKGEPELCLVNYRRYKRELAGTLNDKDELAEDERIIQNATKNREMTREEEARRMAELHFRLGPWSLEHGGDSDLESNSEFPMGFVQGNSSGEPQLGESSTRAYQQRSFLFADASATPNRHSGTFQTDEYKTALEGNVFGSFNALTAGEDVINHYSNFSDISEEDSGVPENFSWVPRLTLEEARRAMRDTVLGLEFLHYQGIIHRDIKPANLLLTHDYRIKISDFGVSYLSKAVTDELGEDQSESEAPDHDEAIELAKTVGTPAFYAPELCLTDFDENNPPQVTNQIDVWALGVTLFCLVFGRVPFYDANTFVLMRQIAEVDVHIPRYRLRAVEVDNNGRVLFDPTLQYAQSPNQEHRRRLGDQLIYEEVDDDLHDLIKGLLEKDPKKRLKLAQVKKHKWLLAGMHDPTAWVKESDPSLMAKGKKIEVSKEDVEHAVRMNTFVDNIRNVTKRIVGTFGGLVKSNTRSRAKSSAAAPGSQPPSTASSSSNMSQDASRLETRRASLRPDELVSSALRASRDIDHPLAQSVTASPEIKEGLQFFTSSSRPESPAFIPHHMGSALNARPDALEREVSATGSVRTIRPTDLHPEGYIPLTAPWPSHFHPEHLGGRGLFSGTVKKRASLYDFDESHPSTEITSPVDESMRAEPTLGISNMTASGLLNRPAGLQDQATASSAAPSPLSFKPESIASYSEFVRIRGSDTMSRVSSNHSVSSIASRSRPTTETYSEHAKGTFLPLMNDGSSPIGKQDSDAEKLRRAKEEQIRRLIKEGQDHLESTHELPPDPNSNMACPPSPDDITFANASRPANAQLPHAASAMELDSTPQRTSVIQTSLSEDHFASEMSQSTSQRSLPSAISASSSVGMDMNSNQYAFGDPKYHGMDTPIAHHEPFETIDYANDPMAMHGYQQLDEDSGDDSDASFVEMTLAKKSKPAATGPTARGTSSNAP